MPINISEDLNITLKIISKDTKTIDGNYAIGNPPDTYLPGLDFSALDSVSTGVVTNYQIGISLSSKSNLVYPIDKLFLSSKDDPQTNGTGIVPFYYINTDPNPENIVDDNNYTPVTSTAANMLSVVFDQNAGVLSTSTLNLNLAVNYPGGLFWKTKIAPKIVAVAFKDGITKTSDILPAQEIRMSSTALVSNDFFRQPIEWSAIRLETKNGVKGFWVPFYFSTSKLNSSNINKLLDAPNMTAISYAANLNFTIDGTVIPIVAENILTSSVGGGGITIENTTLSGNQYLVKLKPNGKIIFPIMLRSAVFLPYDPGAKASVTMQMTGDWALPGGVTFENWQNEYIFSKNTQGGISSSQIIPLSFSNPPRLMNQVSSLIQPPQIDVTSDINFSSLDMFSVAGSKMMLLYDSKVSFLGDTPKFLSVSYVKLGEVLLTTFLPPPSTYVQQFGYAPLPLGYSANAICQSAFNGGITLGSYSDIVAAGNTPNILVTTILSDVLSGQNIDYSKNVNITYQAAKTPTISNTDFLTMYQSTPSADFTSHLYTSMQMGTNFASVAAANAKYGSSIAPIDSFVSINGKVFLNLATNTKGQSQIAFRFLTASTVRADLPVPSYRTNFQTSITNDNLSTITSIADYTATYNLRFFILSSSVAFSSAKGGTFKAGNTLNFAIPPNILPYIYLAGTPAIYLLNPSISSPILIEPITDFSLSTSGIKIKMPKDILFYNQINSVFLNIPIKFLLPAENQVFAHQNTIFNNDNLLLFYPEQLPNGFAESSPYYTADIRYVTSTLLGAGIDFTGLTVNKNFYPSATTVEYIANVKNISNVTDSIYMALTVPTNKYNPIETSNNSQPAYINWITSFFPSAVIYYQTAANATSADILAMKQINQPGATLADYYNSVIVNNWVLHHENDTLPSDVVMAVAYCPNLAKGAIARVDFSTTVQMDALTTETFVNESAFNYYSSASTLETQSNKVSIQNFTLVNNIKIEKSPLLQSIDGINGATGSFAIPFDMPQNAGAFDSITFFDQLPPALTLLSSSTLQIGDAAPIALGATINSAKLVSKTFTNLAEMAGKSILIFLNISVDKANLIPTSLNDTNQASLIINGNSELVSLSNIVNVNYVYKNDFDLTKQPLTQNHEKTAGEKIVFEIFFKVPKDISSITKMVITDILHPALQYDAANSLLQIGTTSVQPLNADLTNNTITVNFTQFSSSADQLIKITLTTILNNPAVLPESNKIENFATITINDIPAYSFVSNTVTATFGKQVQKIPISKFPPSQQIKKTLGAIVPFVFAFSLPPQIDGYNTIKITDVLAPCLSFDAGASTIKIGQNSPLPLVAIVTGSLVTIDLVVTKEMAGKIVTINFGTTLFDISKIPTSNQIANVCDLMINNDQTLISESNKVEVLFIDIPTEKNPQKTSDTKNFEISKDKIINFKIKFFSKFVQLQNMKMLIMDAIDPALQIISYSLDLPASPSITIVDQTSLNTIAFSIETSFPLGANEPFPEFFNLTITAKYVAGTVKDENYVIKNSAQISFGSAPPLLSNEILIPTLCQGEQAIADLIESVALEQAALSHIINAEGEKIQAMLKMPNVTSANLLAANKSVEKMIKSISMLEMLLLKKLEIAKANISKCKQRNK